VSAFDLLTSSALDCSQLYSGMRGKVSAFAYRAKVSCAHRLQLGGRRYTNAPEQRSYRRNIESVIVHSRHRKPALRLESG
jgi:hypothetical protein